MKLYITVNHPIPSGYTGIDLAKQNINFDDIDSICEAAECTEIILDKLLSYIAIDELNQLLQKIISRLRTRGKIIFKDTDFSEISKSYINGRLNIQDINYLLFGKGQISKCGAYSISNIKSIVEQMELEIISIQLDSGYYTLIAQRS